MGATGGGHAQDVTRALAVWGACEGVIAGAMGAGAATGTEVAVGVGEMTDW